LQKYGFVFGEKSAECLNTIFRAVGLASFSLIAVFFTSSHLGFFEAFEVFGKEKGDVKC
jgi:hypothetical protein